MKFACWGVNDHLLQLFRKHITVQITCADSKLLLNSLLQSGITVRNITYCSDLVLQVTVKQDQSSTLQTMARKMGASVKILEKKGVFWQFDVLLRRPVLMAAVMFLFVMTCFLPTRVLFVFVEGNETVPQKKIVEAAQICGLRFGVSARGIRSESLKNALLEQIPQLQWAGVNVKGCTVRICVREKKMAEQTPKPGNQVSSIVASRDGIIQSCTVYQGNPLCKVGQAVNVGQTLVSGYLDYGIVKKATQADAEIRALTFRTLELVAPDETLTRGDVCKRRTTYSIKIGKKVIKFSKDSGNLDATCAKIYSEKCVTLPGGFQLPVSIIKLQEIAHDTGEPVSTSADSGEWLEKYARTYLQDTMIAGEIISEQVHTELLAGADSLYGRYACSELIGQVRQEQMLLKDESE